MSSRAARTRAGSKLLETAELFEKFNKDADDLHDKTLVAVKISVKQKRDDVAMERAMKKRGFLQEIKAKLEVKATAAVADFYDFTVKVGAYPAALLLVGLPLSPQTWWEGVVLFVALLVVFLFAAYSLIDYVWLQEQVLDGIYVTDRPRLARECQGIGADLRLSCPEITTGPQATGPVSHKQAFFHSLDGISDLSPSCDHLKRGMRKRLYSLCLAIAILSLAIFCRACALPYLFSLSKVTPPSPPPLRALGL